MQSVLGAYVRPHHLHNAILISSPQHRSCAMYFSLRALIIILRHSNQSLVPSDVQQVYSHQHDDYFSCICIYCSSNQVYSCPPPSVGRSVVCPLSVQKPHKLIGSFYDASTSSQKAVSFWATL